VLKHQVLLIGVTYCALSILGITFGFLLLHYPERFADDKLRNDANMEIGEEKEIVLEQLHEKEKEIDVTNETFKSYNETDEINLLDEGDILESLKEYSDEIVGEETTRIISDKKKYFNDNLEEDIEVEEAMEEIEPSSETKHYQQIISYLKNEGIEATIGSSLKLLCSVFLIQGVRSRSPWLLVPWLVEESIEMVGGFIHFTVQAARNREWSVSSVILGILFYILGCYFLYSVASYHSMLRRMNKNSTMIVASVSQGVTGFQYDMNYHRLEEGCWQSRPNLDQEFRTEKKIEVEDDGDEHVLYVQ